MKYLIAHDLGTSGNKVTLFNTDGELIDSFTSEYNTKWFNNGWAEQSATDWYDAVCTSTRRILKHIDSSDVVGISFSGQMMGCLCLDRDGRVLHDPIIWADKRATEEEEFIRSQFSDFEFYQITGHRVSASYSLAKLLWIKNNRPEVYNKTHVVLNAKDYILYRLTGEFVTDFSDASGTNLLDINTLRWSKKIADRVGIDLNKMPVLKKSTDVIGYINSTVAAETGLTEGTPVICGGGDGVMSAVGARSINPKDAFCTIGTSAWFAITDETPVFDREERTFNWVHVIPGRYLPCGTMEAAGASISWGKNQMLRDEREPYEVMNSEVDKTEPGANGLFYLPYLMGERSPWWDSSAKGCFIGLNMETTRGHMFRAIYEGIVMNLDIILNLVTKGRKIDQLIVTGGAVKSSPLVKILADIFDVEILIPNYLEEATAIGAALTAGVGVGVYESFDRIRDFIKINKRVEPENGKFYTHKKSTFQTLYKSLKPVFKDI